MCHRQEVFLTQHHLAIAMEFVEGGDLAQYVQEHRLPGVRDRPLAPCVRCWQWLHCSMSKLTERGHNSHPLPITQQTGCYL